MLLAASRRAFMPSLHNEDLTMSSTLSAESVIRERHNHIASARAEHNYGRSDFSDDSWNQ